MEIIFLRKFVFIFLILFAKIKCDENDYCNKFTDCYKCSLCNDENNGACKCSWTNKGCIYNWDNVSGENEKWYSKIIVCQTFDRLNDAENIYCPKSLSKKTESNLDKDNSIEYTIQPDSNGFYGKDMSICNFEFEQGAHKDIVVTIEFSSHIYKYPKVYIESTDISNTKTKTTIDNNGDIEFDENSKITIKVLLKQEYTVSPITIKLSIKTSNKALIITLIIIILLVLVIITFIIFYICRNKKNKGKNRKLSTENSRQVFQNMAIIIQNNNVYINNSQENDNRLAKLNRQKLNKLFNNKMIKHIYKKEYNQYGGGCSICLNKFNEKSEVSITSCKHVFHYKCIHNWLYKNIKNPKCPNCNYDILDDEDNLDKKMEKNIMTIVKRYRCSNSNKLLIQHDIIRRAITLDLNNQSLNGNSSQRQQIQKS